MTFSIMTPILMTLGISINRRHLLKHYCYAECHNLNILLSGILLSVVVLNVIKKIVVVQSVVMVSVGVPRLEME